MRLWAMRAPLWIVFVVMAAIFGGAMGAFVLTQRIQPVAALVGGLFAGLFFSAFMTWFLANRRSRFWAALGRQMPDEDVREIVRYVRRGQVPEDPDRRDAVRRVAAMQRVGPKTVLLLGVEVVAFGAFASWRATRSSPWWWLAVAAWVAVAAVSLLELHRQRTLWRRLG